MPKPNVPNPHHLAAGFDQVKGKVANKLGNLIRRNSSACFYIGEIPQSLGIPTMDLRSAFCLNRGNVSCLPAIPLFSNDHANTQMEETCKRFCEEFVRVVEKDGSPARVILPHCCRGLKREFSYDSEALLKFVWRFLANSKERGQPSRKTHVAFTKFRRDPRTPQDLKRYQFGLPELMVDPFRKTKTENGDISIKVEEDSTKVPVAGTQRTKNIMSL
jgi:hypothetical protein